MHDGKAQTKTHIMHKDRLNNAYRAVARRLSGFSEELYPRTIFFYFLYAHMNYDVVAMLMMILHKVNE